MTLARLIAALVCIASIAITGNAFGTPHRLLLPLSLSGPASGGFGSVWTTHTTILNASGTAVTVYGLLPGCSFDPCVIPPVLPDSTEEVHPYVGWAFPTRFLIVDSSEVAAIRVQLRTVDTSRQLNTWGTEVPVIDENASTSTALDLLDVPLDASFRVLLRIYDFDSADGHAARIRVFTPGGGTASDTLVSETTVALQPSPQPLEYPGYTQLTFPFGDVAPVGGFVRVEIAPVSSFRLWAFASVTNNSTQHVTLVTPLR